jgi:hypothetical protein
MSQDLNDFFKLLAEDKKQKKEEFDNLVGDLGLNSLFGEFAAIKKEQKEKKIEEKKKTESIIGELTLDSVFKEVVNLKKETKKKKVQEQKTIQAFETWLYSDSVLEQDEIINEVIEESLEEVLEVLEDNKEELEEFNKIEEPTLIEKSLGLLAEPSDVKQQNDPLTPLDQKFATLDDLQKHYSTFLSRIQQQLSTLGGGGETRLRYLDDIVGIATNSGVYNNKFLQWNSTTNKSEFVTINSGNIVGIVTGYYGNFFDTTTQDVVGVNTYQSVRLNTTDLSNQVSIANSSHIVVANSGVYNIQFSLQIDKTQGSQAHIYIWLKKNGVDVPNSASEVSVQGTLSETIAAWNFVVASNANDYYELMWSATDIHIRLKAVSANGVVPAIPSVIVSVVSV